MKHDGAGGAAQQSTGTQGGDFKMKVKSSFAVGGNTKYQDSQSTGPGRLQRRRDDLDISQVVVEDDDDIHQPNFGGQHEEDIVEFHLNNI